MGVTPKKLSLEFAKESVEKLVDEIVNGADSHWQAYLDRLAAERNAGLRIGLFKTWSANNMFYLDAQVHRRGANVKGLWAGVDQWRKLGRAVREAEEPFLIFGQAGFMVRGPRPANTQAAATAGATAGTAPTQTAPATTAAARRSNAKQSATRAIKAAARSNKNAANGQNQTAAKPARPAGTWVNTAPPVIKVYDWTQTVAVDPDYVEPDWGVPLAHGDRGTLRQLAASSPVPVRFEDLASRNEHGWLDKDGICVDETMPVGNRIFTLVHELAHHHLGHLERISTTANGGRVPEDERALCEQEAALTQYLTMKMLGLDEAVGNDITVAAGQYIRRWQRTDRDGNVVAVEGHKSRRRLVLKHMSAAIKATDAIVTAYMQAAEQAAEQAVPVAALAS